MGISLQKNIKQSGSGFSFAIKVLQRPQNLTILLYKTSPYDTMNFQFEYLCSFLHIKVAASVMKSSRQVCGLCFLLFSLVWLSYTQFFENFCNASSLWNLEKKNVLTSMLVASRTFMWIKSSIFTICKSWYFLISKMSIRLLFAKVFLLKYG